MNSGEASALPVVSSLTSESRRHEGLVSLEDSCMKMSAVSGKWESSKRLDSQPARGALLTKGPDSSFAEAHRGVSSEPTHMEDEVKDQEDEVEDGRDKCA